MFATSNNDKNIRIRALHDGKLLYKIPVAESISNLLFILNDNYLLATSVEGYIYFYKINQNFISKLIRDKELINSMEEKNVYTLIFLSEYMINNTEIETKADNNYNLYSLENNDKLFISNNIRLSIMKVGRKKSDMKYIKKECNFKIINYNYNNKKNYLKK